VSHTINLKIGIDLFIWSQGPKRRFSKNEKRSHPPIYKCSKFQYDLAIFDFYTLSQSFRTKRVPKAQKWRFWKNEQNFPRYSSNLQVCQFSTCCT